MDVCELRDEHIAIVCSLLGTINVFLHFLRLLFVRQCERWMRTRNSWTPGVSHIVSSWDICWTTNVHQTRVATFHAISGNKALSTVVATVTPMFLIVIIALFLYSYEYGNILCSFPPRSVAQSHEAAHQDRAGFRSHSGWSWNPRLQPECLLASQALNENSDRKLCLQSRCLKISILKMYFAEKPTCSSVNCSYFAFSSLPFIFLAVYRSQSRTLWFPEIKTIQSALD